MMIHMACACGKRLKAGPGLVGRSVKCSAGGATLVVPAVSTAPPRPAPAAAAPISSPVAVAAPPATVAYSCPHCASHLEVAAVHAGGEAQCGVCGGRTIVPKRARLAVATARPAASCFTPATIPTASENRGAVNVPILVSAIGNLVVGIFWVSTVCGAIFGVPMLVLCVFEFVHYSKSETLPPENFASQASTLGVLEIVAGLFNMVSFVCGIITLIHVGKYRRQVGLK